MVIQDEKKEHFRKDYYKRNINKIKQLHFATFKKMLQNRCLSTSEV